MAIALLLVFLLPALGVPAVFFTGRKSVKAAAFLVAIIALINIGLILTTVPTVWNNDLHRYTESYSWIPLLKTYLNLFTDGITIPIAIIALILIFAAAIYSINYMAGKKDLPTFYALLMLLSIGLVGVFITSNLLLFYFCWELMLVPAYFIIGGWGYKDSYRVAFKFFVFTHAGAVFVLLGIGSIYIFTGASDMFAAQSALMSAAPGIAQWILLALTAGFAVKMAVVPVHMWLPDAHSEAPSPMSALLSGVIISAGAYAILRLSLVMVFPAAGMNSAGTALNNFGTQFLHGLAVFGVITAFFGSFIALVETDIKRIIAYSSISHMGYILFGLSLFAFSDAGTGSTLLAVNHATVGTVMQIVNHGVSKGLFFLSAGAVMHQLGARDIREMGGLAGKLPFTTTVSSIAALSIAGAPPFACFISEFLIFVGAFSAIKIDSFYLIPMVLMLVATVLSLGYALRFISRVFLGPAKTGVTYEGNVREVPLYMKIAMGILAAFVIILGIYPTFFINLITTVRFI
jgi:NADH-quinone oxidoreductase subunit M